MAGSEQWLTEAEFQAVAQQLDALVQEFERLPFPQVREMAFDMLQAVDAMHREALRRLLALLHAHGQAHLVEHATNDPIIRTLFQLYDLIPSDERKEVETALELVRPEIHSQLFIPLTEVRRDAPPQPSPVSPRRPIFAAVARVADVPAGTMRAFDVQGTRVLIANVSGELYAVRNTCPGSMAPLELGSFTPPVVVCPWHNEAYDIRTGKRVDGSPLGATGQNLAVLPIAIVDDTIQLAMNTTSDVAAAANL